MTSHQYLRLNIDKSCHLFVLLLLSELLSLINLLYFEYGHGLPAICYIIVKWVVIID